MNGGARSDNHHSNTDHDHHHDADHHPEAGASDVPDDHVRHDDLGVWAERTIKHPLVMSTQPHANRTELGEPS